MNIHFCTFGDEPRFTNTLAALLEEAKTSGYFDTVRKFNQHDLPVDHNLRAYLSRTRGYGYWSWKPMIIADMLLRCELGDDVVYADAGCGISVTPAARQAFGDWMGAVTTHPTHRLAFQMSHREDEYTKADVFEALECTDVEYKHSGQHIATIQILTNTLDNRRFVAQWLRCCVINNFRLVSDYPSMTPNPPVFKAHRHDQSIVSLLLKKWGAAVHADHWMNPDYPIMALRRRKRMDLLQRAALKLGKVFRAVRGPRESVLEGLSGPIPAGCDQLIASLEVSE